MIHIYDQDGGEHWINPTQVIRLDRDWVVLADDTFILLRDSFEFDHILNDMNRHITRLYPSDEVFVRHGD